MKGSQSLQVQGKLVIVLAWVLTCLALSGTSFAASPDGCPWIGKLASWNHYYNGRLGDGETVRVALRFRGCKISGGWFDSISFKTFKIRGSISRSRRVTLSLLNRKKHVVATVIGDFPRHDVFGIVQGRLNTDLLLGHLVGHFGYNEQTVILQESRIWDGTEAQVAADVGIKDLKSFNRATVRFWKAVKDHNEGVVAQCIRYPLQVYVYHPKSGSMRYLVIKNRRMLVRDYRQIFNWDATDNILSHLPRYLIWTADGRAVRLGGSAAVFDPQGKVVAVGSGYVKNR